MIKAIYKPFSLIISVLGGLVAGAVFKQVWRRVAGEDDAPNATDLDSTWKEVLISATVHGAIFGAIKALIGRAGATGVHRATGTWPGNTEPRHTSD